MTTTEERYLTRTDLREELRHYATKADLQETLNHYPTKVDLQETLRHYDNNADDYQMGSRLIKWMVWTNIVGMSAMGVLLYGLIRFLG